MVKYNDEVLDRTFAALADPTRRALLARLGSRDSISVSELAQPFAMSLPAVMKHLDVLSDAGLVAREKTGRTVACRLTADPMEQAMEWLNRYQRFWSRKSRPPCRIRGGRHMATPSAAASNAGLASRPSLTLKRRINAVPEKVYAAWTDPEKIARWFGPSQVKAGSVQAEIDLRVGGRYRISFESRGWRVFSGRRRLSRGDAERADRVQLGVALDAGTGIAGHGVAAAGWRRHAADAAP